MRKTPVAALAGRTNNGCEEGAAAVSCASVCRAEAPLPSLGYLPRRETLQTQIQIEPSWPRGNRFAL